MEQRKVNPWTWQDNFGFSQAIEFRESQPGPGLRRPDLG